MISLMSGKERRATEGIWSVSGASAIVIIGGYRASALNRRQVMKNSSRDTR